MSLIILFIRFTIIRSVLSTIFNIYIYIYVCLFYIGIATHYIASNKISELEKLIETECPENPSEARKVILSILKSMHQAPPNPLIKEEMASFVDNNINIKNHTNIIKPNKDIIA